MSDIDWKSRFFTLVEELKTGFDIGIYPAAIIGEGGYEERDDYKNGWNDAALELIKKMYAMIEKHSSSDLSDDLMLLTLADVGWYEDGEFVLNMNDTWAWASAFGQSVPKDKIGEVAKLYRSYGWMGLVYWVSKQNDNMTSEFKDINRFIEIVEHEEQLIKDEPSSSKRAYTQISYTVGNKGNNNENN